VGDTLRGDGIVHAYGNIRTTWDWWSGLRLSTKGGYIELYPPFVNLRKYNGYRLI